MEKGIHRSCQRQTKRTGSQDKRCEYPASCSRHDIMEWPLLLYCYVPASGVTSITGHSCHLEWQVEGLDSYTGTTMSFSISGWQFSRCKVRKKILAIQIMSHPDCCHVPSKNSLANSLTFLLGRGRCFSACPQQVP